MEATALPAKRFRLVGCISILERLAPINTIDRGKKPGNLLAAADVLLETTGLVERIMAKDGKFRWSKLIWVLAVLGAAAGVVSDPVALKLAIQLFSVAASSPAR